ncbi:adenosine receptor A1-like [Glandiceps talaboti]
MESNATPQYSLPTNSGLFLNSSSEGLTSDDIIYYSFYYSIIVIITLVNIVGNLLVITSVIRFRHLRNVCSYFIVNLAVSDLLMGLIYTPYNLSHMEIPEIESSMDSMFLCLFFLGGVEVFHCCSAWSLVAITVTRYISIFHPLRYHERVTPRRTLLAITLVWVLSFSYSFAQYARPVDQVNFHGRCRYELMYTQLWHTLAISTFVFMIPLTIMITLYTRIWLIARKQLRAINYDHDRSSFKHEWKITKMIAMILGYFVLAWTPMLVFLYIKMSCDCEVNRYIRAICRIFLHSNSAVNFIIYGVCNTEFSAAFRRSLTQMFYCKKVYPHVNFNQRNGTVIQKRKGRLAKLCTERGRPLKITFV